MKCCVSGLCDGVTEEFRPQKDIVMSCVRVRSRAFRTERDSASAKTRKAMPLLYNFHSARSSSRQRKCSWRNHWRQMTHNCRRVHLAMSNSVATCTSGNNYALREKTICGNDVSLPNFGLPEITHRGAAHVAAI